MRFGDLRPGRPRGEVVIAPRNGGEPVSVQVVALPLGSIAKAAELFPEPTAPKRYRQKPGTGAVEFDRQGRPIADDDREDPAYKRGVREADRLQSAYILALGIDDPRWEWQTSRSLLEENPRAFCEGIHAEMRDFGLTDGEVSRLCREIFRLSSVTPASIEKALQAFLSGEAGE